MLMHADIAVLYLAIQLCEHFTPFVVVSSAVVASVVRAVFVSDFGKEQKHIFSPNKYGYVYFSVQECFFDAFLLTMHQLELGCGL